MSTYAKLFWFRYICVYNSFKNRNTKSFANAIDSFLCIYMFVFTIVVATINAGSSAGFIYYVH